MKIVYVLTSDDTDFYLEQLAVSLKSLLLHNPELAVEIVVDQKTYQSLDERRSALIAGAQVRPFDVPDGFNKMQRSRWLKTSLRNLIDGDYLFVDTDTVICGPLPLDQLPTSELCAVKDLHVPIRLHSHLFDIQQRAKIVEWDVTNLDQVYHNSGVMLVRDTAQTRAFYEAWNREWIKSAAKGCSSDQPALCKVNLEFGDIIQPLPDRWNCQVTENGLRFLDQALIVHYFASGKSPARNAYLLNSKEIYLALRNNGFTDDILCLISHPKEAFFNKVQLISDTDVDFYNSPLCKHLRKFFYSSPKLYDRIIRLGRKIKH